MTLSILRFRGLFGLIEQVGVRRLQSQYSLGQVIEAQAVGSFPLTQGIFITDFQDHLGKQERFSISLNRVLKDRGPHRADLKDFFWFGHFPQFPPFPISIGYTNLYDRQSDKSLYIFGLMQLHQGAGAGLFAADAEADSRMKSAPTCRRQRVELTERNIQKGG